MIGFKEYCAQVDEVVGRGSDPVSAVGDYLKKTQKQRSMQTQLNKAVNKSNVAQKVMSALKTPMHKVLSNL